MTEYVGVSGSWKTVGAEWVGVSGAWKQVGNEWVGVGGVWKLAFSAFSPITTNYDTPGTQSITVPLGAQQLIMTVTGGGAGGSGFGSSISGGAGGTAQRTIPIAASTWNTSFNITIGTRGNGGTIGTSGSLSTSTFGAFTLTGNGGDASGPGGTATGGSSNTTGGAGGLSLPGGASFWAAGGAHTTGTTPGGAGSLGSGGGSCTTSTPGIPGGNGGNGRIQLAWT